MVRPQSEHRRLTASFSLSFAFVSTRHSSGGKVVSPNSAMYTGRVRLGGPWNHSSRFSCSPSGEMSLEGMSAGF